jgi:ABC-2 type transport system permease protein
MTEVILELAKLIGYVALFLGLCVLALIPLSVYRKASFALMKRNFFAYFSNPTGYLFLCIFVCLSSIGAFVAPNDFFNANLANLDQLNGILPVIMLFFIPAITMSIWAEEKRQGTDELLLTIPAGDFDIVIGKYLAAVSIFTVSLLFSQLTNYAVLNALTLGDLDTGLFLSTYFGYWMIGLAMLALGMVASFLTSNLTIGFILGAVFNMPLVAIMAAEAVIADSDWAQAISYWSFSQQFGDFGRGVISSSSVTFFTMIVVVGIYLSMVLIGRRHWLGGRDGSSLLGHYLIRVISLVVLTVGLNLLFARNDVIRMDMTDENVSSLSRDTRTLLDGLELERPIYIEAFISASLPEAYTKTKFDLITLLNEFQAIGGGDVVVTIYDGLEAFSDEAARAEEQYGITAETVLTRSRGAFKQQDVFLGAAFTCGLEKVVVPFFDQGIPVEYEMVRSICTVAQEERQKIGVVKTDAELFGGFQMMGMQPRNIPKQLIIEELEKQYDVVEVDPNSPIVESYDALLAVQPSTLTPPQLDNLIDAIKNGTPTAIFEDPMPVALASAVGTSQPKRPQGGGMFGQGQPPAPKGDIQQLWSLLGITMEGEEQDFSGGRDVHIVWQDYNPYPKVRGFSEITRQWVFVGPDAPGAENPLNPDEPITSGLQQLLFLFPGAIKKDQGGEGLKFTSLVTTGDQTGKIKFADLMASQSNPAHQRFAEGPLLNKQFVVAARIEGELPDESGDGGDGDDQDGGDQDGDDQDGGDQDGGDQDELTGEDSAMGDGDPDDPAADDSKSEENPGAEDADNKPISVVFVADIDLLHSDFLRLRARPDGEINWQFDNVPFVLNILDQLAGDDRFIEIRKRQSRHSTLKTIELYTKQARMEADETLTEFDKEFKQSEEDAKEQMQQSIEELQAEVDRIQKSEDGKLDRKALEQARMRLSLKQLVEERRRDTRIEELRRDRDRKLKEINRNLELETFKVQNEFKAWAVLLPPIPPLIVGLAVFVYRRLREREGVAKERLK